MAAAQDESAITYEALSDLEMEFDDVETEISAQLRPLFHLASSICASASPY